MDRDANASLNRAPPRPGQPPPSLHTPRRTLGEDDWEAIREAEAQLLLQLEEQAAAPAAKEEGARASGEADSGSSMGVGVPQQHQYKSTAAAEEQTTAAGPGGALLPSVQVPRLVPTMTTTATATTMPAASAGGSAEAPVAPPPAPCFFTFGLTGERMNPRAVLATVDDTRVIRAEEMEEATPVPVQGGASVAAAPASKEAEQQGQQGQARGGDDITGPATVPADAGANAGGKEAVAAAAVVVK